eukprot:1153532-Pelagomonas_calceolata.AAC.1
MQALELPTFLKIGDPQAQRAVHHKEEQRGQTGVEVEGHSQCPEFRDYFFEIRWRLWHWKSKEGVPPHPMGGRSILRCCKLRRQNCPRTVTCWLSAPSIPKLGPNAGCALSRSGCCGPCLSPKLKLPAGRRPVGSGLACEHVLGNILSCKSRFCTPAAKSKQTGASGKGTKKPSAGAECCCGSCSNQQRNTTAILLAEGISGIWTALTHIWSIPMHDLMPLGMITITAGLVPC